MYLVFRAAPASVLRARAHACLHLWMRMSRYVSTQARHSILLCVAGGTGTHVPTQSLLAHTRIIHIYTQGYAERVPANIRETQAHEIQSMRAELAQVVESVEQLKQIS